MTLSESLKRFRREFNFTQKKVADRLNMQQSLYHRYESGETVPAVTFIVKLADAFNVSTDYLLGRSDTPKPVGVDEKEVQAARAFREQAQAFSEKLKQFVEGTAS